MPYQNPEYEGWYVVTATRYNHTPEDFGDLVPAVAPSVTEVLTTMYGKAGSHDSPKCRLFVPLLKAEDEDGDITWDPDNLSAPVAFSYTATEVYKVLDIETQGTRDGKPFQIVTAVYDRGGIWGAEPGQTKPRTPNGRVHYYTRFRPADGKYQNIASRSENTSFWVGRHAELKDAGAYEPSELTNSILYYIPSTESSPVKFLTEITTFSALVRYNDPDPAHYLSGIFFDDRDPNVNIDKFLAYQQDKARGIVDSAWKMTH